MKKTPDITEFDPPAALKRRPPKPTPAARKGAAARGLSDVLRSQELTKFMGLDLPALEIGERIRSARQARGLTQVQLAGRVGCQQSDLSDIERGQGTDGPRYGTLRRIAQALGVELTINPAPKPNVDVVVISGAGTVLRAASYDTYEPLLSVDLWRRVKQKVLQHPLQGFDRDLDQCVLLSVKPDSRARIRPFKGAVIIQVKGGGRIHVSGARYRSASTKEPMIVLMGDDSELEVSTGSDELTLMMMPPAIFQEDGEAA